MNPIRQNTTDASNRCELFQRRPWNVKILLAKLWSAGIAVCAIFCCGHSMQALAIGSGDAATAGTAYNSAFLYSSGSTAYYVTALNNSANDYFWELAEDIQAQESVFEHTGGASDQTLVNNLCNTFLTKYGPPWTWDNWNDDVGRVSQMLVRGYKMTGTANFLTQAEYGFNLAYNRGWNTTFNGGGMYEEMGVTNPLKESVAADSCGMAAAMIYQAGGGSTYLTDAETIYNWERTNLFEPTTGKVRRGVYTNGVIDAGFSNFNQGEFIDFANYLYEITGNSMYFNDAQAAFTFTQTNLTDANGILTSGVGSLSRAMGHFVCYNRLWGTYYSWMLNNANSAWNNRRTDLNIGWNTWDTQTPSTNTLTPSLCSSAVEWLQFTPATQPPGIAGTHFVYNKYSDLVLEDPGSSTQKGTDMDQWGYNGGANQQWTFGRNSDGSYTITNGASGMVLEDYASATTNGAAVDQWTSNGNSNQRWNIKPQQDGFYTIVNEASGKDLEDYGWSTSNGGKMDQWTDTGGANQRWLLQ
jgi:hypothetical protein